MGCGVLKGDPKQLHANPSNYLEPISTLRIHMELIGRIPRTRFPFKSLPLELQVGVLGIPNFGKRRYFLTTSGSGQTFPQNDPSSKEVFVFCKSNNKSTRPKRHFSRWPLALSRERSGGASGNVNFNQGPFGHVFHKRGLKNVLFYELDQATE